MIAYTCYICRCAARAVCLFFFFLYSPFRYCVIIGACSGEKKRTIRASFSEQARLLYTSRGSLCVLARGFCALRAFILSQFYMCSAHVLTVINHGNQRFVILHIFLVINSTNEIIVLASFSRKKRRNIILSLSIH